jgi:apolipoprotein N-acyltransferase
MAGLIRTFARDLGTLIPHRSDWRAMGWSGVGGTLLSAGLLWLAFPPVSWGWTAWFGLVPIFLVTRGRDPRAAKWLWYLFGVVWTYACIWWFSVTAYVNPLVIPAIVLMALILGLWALLFGWATIWLRRLGGISLALIPLAWVAIEHMRTWGELAFPWLFLAHTQHAHPALIQSASIFGTHLLTALIVGANLLVAELVFLFLSPSPRIGRGSWGVRALAVAIWLTLLAVSVFGGKRALARWNQPPGDGALRVTVLQPNWDQRDKLAAQVSDTVARRLFRDLIMQLNEVEEGTTDLVILPESVILDFTFPLGDPPESAALRAQARRIGATLVFGANRAELREGVQPVNGQVALSDLAIHNSVYSMTHRGGESWAIYDKMRLVPFSESAPLISLIPGLSDLTLGPLVFLEPGVEPLLLLVSSSGGAIAMLGAHVCFESTFPGAVRQFAQAEAELLATVTNDGWFLDTAGAEQHWIVQPFRAVENRRWMIQSANTGISSVVNPAGVVVGRTRLSERATLEARVQPLQGTTVYTRHGDWLAQLSLLLTALGIGAAIRRHRRAERQRTSR